MTENAQKLLVEFLGPLALVFIGAGSIVATGGKDLVAIALAHGLAIGLMIMAAGHISGGLFNPALVVGLVATRRLSVPLGIGYVVVELLGGIAGALLLGAGFTTQQLDAVKFGTPLPAANLSIGQAILIEAVLTFFLMFSVFGNAIDPRSPKAIAGLAIGLTITMDIFGGGGLTGAAMNPARSIGPELVGGIWDFWYVYWIGPIVGAVIAALIYEYVLIAVPKPVAEAPHP